MEKPHKHDYVSDGRGYYYCKKCREWLIDSEKPKSVENNPIIQDEEFNRCD